MHRLSYGIGSLLHSISINLIPFTVLLVHLIWRISPHHSPCIHSQHLLLLQPFTPVPKQTVCKFQMFSSLWFPFCLRHDCDHQTTYIRLIITYDTPHSGTMIYAVTLSNSPVSRYGKIACGWWNYPSFVYSRHANRLFSLRSALLLRNIALSWLKMYVVNLVLLFNHIFKISQI